MLKWKKAAAILLAAAMTGSLAGCSSTAYALTIDGTQLKAGVYIYYSYASHSELTQTLQSQNSELDITDDDLVKEQKMDNEDAETWIQNKTMEYCQRHVAIADKFDELGLSLSEEEKTEISTTLDSFWDTNGETYEKNGISKGSVEDVLKNTYMTDDVFMYYYDVDGENGVTEDELKEYYQENNARVRYIQFDLKDGNGELLKSDGKDEMMDMVEKYLSDLEKLDDEDEMEDQMDEIQSEYNAYVTSISEEAAAETATSATDAEGNEIAATTTEATTTTIETTTTTAAEEESADSDTTETAGEDSAAETTAAEESNAEETTAAEDETSAETTTTTAPYASEQIIAKVTTDEDTKEEDITYTPSKKVYDYIFGDAKLGVPTIVEDDEAYYLVLCRDITERMTEDDLWTEDMITSVIQQKYSDAFMDTLDEWCAKQTVEKNDRAIKRYDPFKIDMSSSQA